MPRKPLAFAPQPPQRVVLTRDGVAVYKCPSRSREAIAHDVYIDLASGRCECGCEHFHFNCRPQARHARIKIMLTTPDYHCSHIKDAIQDCVRRGELKLAIITPFGEIMAMEPTKEVMEKEQTDVELAA